MSRGEDEGLGLALVSRGPVALGEFGSHELLRCKPACGVRWPASVVSACQGLAERTLLVLAGWSARGCLQAPCVTVSCEPWGLCWRLV